MFTAVHNRFAFSIPRFGKVRKSVVFGQKSSVILVAKKRGCLPSIDIKNKQK